MSNIPTSALEVPAAWRGPEATQSEEWIYRLTETDIAELDGAIQKAKALTEKDGRTLDSLTEDDLPLPTLKPVIDGWARDINEGLGFVLVKGFPVEKYTKAECAIAYWAIGRHVGKPVSQNSEGELLTDIRDTGANPDDPNIRLYKTRKKQEFHTDGSDIVTLFCLRKSKSGGLSRIVSSVSIFNEITRRRPELVPLLFEPWYFDRHGEQPEGMPAYFVLPICNYTNGFLRTFYLGWYIWQAQRHKEVPRLTQDQIDLLELIEGIANDPAFYLDMDFEIGDMQFIKNSTILHQRTEYEDYDDPDQKRHLLRLWLAGHKLSSADPSLRGGIEKVTAAK